MLGKGDTRTLTALNNSTVILGKARAVGYYHSFTQYLFIILSVCRLALLDSYVRLSYKTIFSTEVVPSHSREVARCYDLLKTSKTVSFLLLLIRREMATKRIKVLVYKS